MRARTLDSFDHKILQELQADARLSMRELSRRIGLSAPAVTERVRRLEDRGVLLGYRALVSPGGVGRDLVAYVAVQDSGKRDPELTRWAREHPGVLECHSVTGRSSCMLKVAVPGVVALEELLGELIDLGFTCDTSIVLSSPLPGKPLGPPPA